MTPALELPVEIRQLMDDGLWPLDSRACQLQNLHPIVPREVVRTFAPDEYTIFLYRYPFSTVEQQRKINKYWEKDKRSALGEIDPHLSLIIADFGPGSDTVLILDYRTPQPRLLRLQWGTNENHWVECGLTVAEFASLIRRHKRLSPAPPST